MPPLRTLWRQYLVIEFIIACVLALHLGPDGLVREFCDMFPVDRCEDFEFESE